MSSSSPTRLDRVTPDGCAYLTMAGALALFCGHYDVACRFACAPVLTLVRLYPKKRPAAPALKTLSRSEDKALVQCAAD